MSRHRQFARPAPPQSEPVCDPGPRWGWRRLTAPQRENILGTWWIFPRGEEWNQATIPRPARPVIDEQDLGDGATLGHDELYRYHGALPRAWLDRSVPGAVYRTYTRDEADTFLWARGALEGVTPWKGWLGHRVVRIWWWLAETLRLSPAW